MKKYTFTLQSDNGKVKVSLITTSSLTDAIKSCLKIEDAPECAILKVKIKNL